MNRFLTAVAAIIGLASPAAAATLSLRLVDQTGQAVEDAVVSVVPAAGRPAGPIRFPWAPSMVQQNIQFMPHVLVVPVGATVNFPNRDRVRHHIYSFSKPARFELKLYGREETRSYTFRTAGAVAVGCNIHDAMTGFIKVVDTPFAAKSGKGGDVTIDNLPAGTARVSVWHPRLAGRGNEMTLAITMPARGTVNRPLRLTVQR